MEQPELITFLRTLQSKISEGIQLLSTLDVSGAKYKQTLDNVMTSMTIAARLMPQQPQPNPTTNIPFRQDTP